MKRVIPVLLALMLVSGSASRAFGQSFEFGPKLGYSIALGDFGDVADDGFAVGLFVNYFMSQKTSLELSYLRHVHDTGHDAGDFSASPDDIIDDFASIDDGDLTMNEFTASAVHRFSKGKIRPYLTGGGGVYVTRLKLQGQREDVSTATTTDTSSGPDGTTTGTSTEVSSTLVDHSTTETLTDFGLRGGGGVTFMLTGEISLGIEAVYTYVFGDFDDGFVNLVGLMSYGF